MATRHYASPFQGKILLPICGRSFDLGVKPISRRCIRSMATEVTPITTTSSSTPPPSISEATVVNGLRTPSRIPQHLLSTQNVLTTVYSWPTMAPLKFTHYPATHLAVPLRRDILHRAVVYEGDKTRQGTASTKHRSDMHGSGQKLRPQKGTGRARLGDRKSPMLRGGGVAHGPKPRDFATDLPRKVYDKAWRMALSYRYKRGQLVVVEKIGIPDDIESAKREYWLRWALDGLGWASRKEGHSFFITMDKQHNHIFAEAMEKSKGWGRVRDYRTVDVKNLLEMKRLVIEEEALMTILKQHQHDLRMPLGGKGLTTRAIGAAIPPAVDALSREQMDRAVLDAQAVAGDSSAVNAATASAAAAAASLVGSGSEDLSWSEVDNAAAEAEAQGISASEEDEEDFDEDEFDDEEDDEDEDEEDDGKGMRKSKW